MPRLWGGVQAGCDAQARAGGGEGCGPERGVWAVGAG